MMLQRSHPGYLTSIDSASRQGGSLHTDDAKIQMWLRGSQSNKQSRQGEQVEDSDADDGGSEAGQPQQPQAIAFILGCLVQQARLKQQSAVILAMQLNA